MALLRSLAIFGLVLAFSFQASFGQIECEDLKKDSCAFAVSSSGKRCVLETRVRRSGEEAYVCSSSGIQADKITNLIETDECIHACGLQRNVLGISSDNLIDSCFTHKLCSQKCYANCPNIVDLYFNLAAGEGIYLPKLCEAKGQNVVQRREMAEIKSFGSSYVVPGPESSLHSTGSSFAPAPASMAPGPESYLYPNDVYSAPSPASMAPWGY